MVAATGARIAIDDGDLGAAREQAVRAYQAAVARGGHADARAGVGHGGRARPGARPAGAGRRAARRGAAVRGADDPTDPTTAKLAPRLRAALGDDRFARAYAAGKALGRAEAIERLDPAG